MTWTQSILYCLIGGIVIIGLITSIIIMNNKK